ncbi:S8 family serine peptidase [Deinococcus sp.]|uniref:S8 family serine peptidase n=1 Tax=Deinococcus sp. TaxID=47478 RepID=UPI002869DF93|nr:S8 family serine peptidase [Deinococcus sp.]
MLSARHDPLFLDDWEACDPDSRRAVLALAAARSGPAMVIGSRERPPLPLPELVLRPLDTLCDGELDITGGLPALLHPHRADLPLADAYAHLLAPHPPRARQLLACLGVQPTPDLKATQAALELGADDMASALETLDIEHPYLYSGTSFAAPLVAGAAALVKGAGLNLATGSQQNTLSTAVSAQATNNTASSVTVKGFMLNPVRIRPFPSIQPMLDLSKY